MIVHGDCVEAMQAMDADSVDAIVTDPPAGISFMAKSWDGNKGGRDAWVAWLCEVMEECWRVAKPGAHALVWALPRTSHWTGWAIEAAGWEVRDRIAHHFGSGFPKSHNLGDGRGTALKPATEDWWLARKPLIGTVAQNCLEHGTGALNVDGCRVEATDGAILARENKPGDNGWKNSSGGPNRAALEGEPAGRWPANVTLSHLPECEAVGTRKVKGSGQHLEHHERTTPGGNDRTHGVMAGVTGADHVDPDGTETVIAYNCAPGCPVAELDRQSGGVGGGDGKDWSTGPIHGTGDGPTFLGEKATGQHYGDTGGASRFFYTAKASRAERNAGLDGFEERGLAEGNKWTDVDYRKGNGEVTNQGHRNNHPTVKPIDLMRWLVRLVTPPDGTVLDPFAGSGTTGCAAVLENFDFIGIEREAEYVEIAKARIEWWAQHQGREADEVLAITRKSEAMRDPAQGSLFGLSEGVTMLGSSPLAESNGREGEASAERRYTENGGSNFAMKPGARRRD